MIPDKRNFPQLAIVMVMAILLGTMLSYHAWNRSKPNERGVIKWDVISYYSYLPATFIYGDVTLRFLDDPAFNNDNKFWPLDLENGNRLIQTSMGLSILYSPFFFMAHGLAPLFGEARDGFSNIYQFFLVLGTLFYVLIGLLFLRKILLRYFSPVASAISLLVIPLGTNLFYYSVHEAAMPHAYNFALITLFLYLVIRWYEKPNFSHTLLLGLVYGFTVLVRPSNILIGLLFLLWGVTGFNAFAERIRFLAGKIPLLLLMLLFFILPWIPQMVYWKTVTGSYLFNSYGPSGSSFYFDSPHIFQLLFSYRKGWYLYTPLMLVATIGLLVMRKRGKAGQWAITLFLAGEIYLLASWWSWWNGGSYGLRSFVDIYGIMAIPLTALTDKMLESRKLVRAGYIGVVAFLVYMSLFQTFQYTRGFIHHSGMTKEAYWLNFLRFRSDGSSWQMLAIPDAQLARMGIYYTYYTGNDYSALKAIGEPEAKALIRQEIAENERLTREIHRAARRQDREVEDLLEEVVNQIYRTKATW